MAQSVTAGGSTTTTYYIAGLEEQANISGGSSTLTKYYSVPGVISAVSVGGTLSVLASDGLGSVSEALSSTSAAATSQQLFGPYGGLRYATGSMPTAKGYTGQYADAASSGLDYYNARYYDPLIGQFTSADSTADGLNRYGYVAGNPETATDPSGHRICNGGDGCGGDGGDGGDGGRLPPPPGGGGGHGGSGGSGGGHGGSGGGAAGGRCASEHCGQRAGWNGCLPDDDVCHGAHAHADAQHTHDDLTNLLKEQFGEWFNDFLAQFNPLEIAKDWGFEKFLSLFVGEAAGFVKGLLTQDSNDAIKFAVLLLAWGSALWEASQSAAWFQSLDNIVQFGYFVKDVYTSYAVTTIATMLGGILSEDSKAVAVAYGLLDGSKGWDMLYDGLYDQAFEFFSLFPSGGGCCGRPVK